MPIIINNYAIIVVSCHVCNKQECGNHNELSAIQNLIVIFLFSVLVFGFDISFFFTLNTSENNRLYDMMLS